MPVIAHATAVAMAIALGIAPASGGGCDYTAWQSACEVSNTGSQVDLGASTTVPSYPVDSVDAPGGDTYPSWDSEEAPAPDGLGSVRACELKDECPDPDPTWVPPDLAVADIASFRPSAPALSGEPAGFGVAGLPTNLVAAASEQVVPGTLLGRDVRVRFVPQGFVFDHGDGTSTRTSSGGASWEALGQPQFSPTATSHVYAERGVYTVTATAQFAAFVGWGSGGWRPVTGIVTSPSGAYDVRIVEASTALVDRTCLEDPGGPGC